MWAKTSPITSGSSVFWDAISAISKFFTYPSHECWISAEKGEEPHPHFGGAQAIYNVIDSRQADPQANVILALRGMGYTEQADHYTHFGYEMVALTPRCAAELGYEVAEEDRERPYIEVSGRKGFGVKADDLIDKLIAATRFEVDTRQTSRDDQERQVIAEQIAIGALRYFMLKFTRNSVIAFDFKDALSFEGETGPYIQYAVVRARNIFRKGSITPEAVLREFAGSDPGAFLMGEDRRRYLGAVAAGRTAHGGAGAVHCHVRARVPGQACLPVGAGVQQLLPQAPCSDGVGSRAADVPAGHGRSHPARTRYGTRLAWH